METPKRILFFDTETTGKANFKRAFNHPTQPHLVQLGALLVDAESRKDLAKISLLTLPDIWSAIDPGATATHGITTEDCQRFGVPSPVVYLLFNNLVKQADRIVCHNAQFDIMIMRALGHRLGKPDRLASADTFCTMRAYTPICGLPGPYGHKWPKLQEAFAHVFDGATFEGAHDALADVIPTKAIYFELPEDVILKGMKL